MGKHRARNQSNERTPMACIDGAHSMASRYRKDQEQLLAIMKQAFLDLMLVNYRGNKVLLACAFFYAPH